MPGVLDVVIGLLFIFLLYSLLATSINEAIATVLHRRANTLYKGVRAMLTNTRPSNGALADLGLYLIKYMWIDLANWAVRQVVGNRSYTLHNEFYNHPIIKNYGQNQLFKKPSYLSPDNFATILVETLKDLDGSNEGKTVTFDMVKKVLEDKKGHIDKETLKILTFHLNEAAGDLDVFKYRLGKWFNDTMDRVSGWYKRNTQFWLSIIGITLAITLNIDTIEIATYLSDNRTAREQLAQMGVAAAGKSSYSGQDSAIAKEVMDSIKADLRTVNTLVGLGWGDYGASDPAFKAYCLDDPDSKMYRAYTGNLGSAARSCDSVLAVFRNSLDTSIANGRKDSVVFRKITDSLAKNRDLIISQKAFAMLYDSEDYESSLRRTYVLCYRIWSYRKWLGFLITAFAIGLGAPFWFDLLNRFVSIRSSVKSVNSSGSTTKNNDTSNDAELDG